MESQGIRNVKTETMKEFFVVEEKIVRAYIVGDSVNVWPSPPGPFVRDTAK